MGSIIVKFALLIAAISYFAITNEVEAKWNGGWSKSTYVLQDKMREVGYSDELSESIINECKKSAKNPRNCVIIASFVGKAESNAWRAKNGNNVFWVMGKKYASKEDSVKEFVKKYEKYWYNQRNPSSFYSAVPNVKPKTYYCLSERSSKSLTHCPNGSKNAWNAYRKLSSIGS